MPSVALSRIRDRTLARIRDRIIARIRDSTIARRRALASEIAPLQPRRSCARRVPAFQDMVRQRGDEVRLALRAKVFCYPEDTVSVWIVAAVCYRSIL